MLVVAGVVAHFHFAGIGQGYRESTGILLIEVYPTIFLAGIGLFALTTLFSFITLPVEIDASVRATRWLQNAGITNPQEQPMAVSALRSAAYTYVAAALGFLATLIYYVLMFLGSGDRD